MRDQRLLVHVGVACAVTMAVVAGVGLVSAAGSGTASSFVPIVPCRLADTRPSDNVGARMTPLQPQETVTLAVAGTNGNCSIPPSATGIATNVTAVNPTANGFMTVFPAEEARPLSSNLNWTPTSSPTPNQVTVGLSVTGSVSIYNSAGTVDVIVDIVGYYEPVAAASQGPAGPAGPSGANGAAGDRGLSAWDVIPSGRTVVGDVVFGLGTTNAGVELRLSVALPAIAPAPLTDNTVNFGTVGTFDEDPSCTGTPAVPTAPPGKVCLYMHGGFNHSVVNGSNVAHLRDRAFLVRWTATTTNSTRLLFTWAYTAP